MGEKELEAWSGDSEAFADDGERDRKKGGRGIAVNQNMAFNSSNSSTLRLEEMLLTSPFPRSEQ